jgi:predicted permease
MRNKMTDKLSQLWRRLLFYLRRDRFDRELEEEMRFHLEMKAQENAEAGMKPSEASYAARRQFGNQTLLREASRDMWRFRSLGTLAQDLRYGLRMMVKNPGFTAVAALTLAFGIGANTAIFSLINVILLKPISGREPERLVGVYSRDSTRADDYRVFSHPNYTDLRAQREVFDDVLANTLTSVGVTEGDTMRRKIVLKISSNYFSVFGVQLALGRPFTTQEETQPAPVAIVSHGWWSRHGAPSDIIGQSIQVNGRPLTVVGVAPKGFTGIGAMLLMDLFLPLSFDQPGAEAAGNPLQDRKKHQLLLVGRLKQGLTLEEANARLKLISARFAEAYPDANHDQLLTVSQLPRMAISGAPQKDRVPIASVGALTLGMSGLVLLIACLNLANLQLARGAARRKEFAVRQALGARGGRLVRQLLTEGFLLAALGGAAGIVLAALATDWLVNSMFRLLPFSFDFDPRPDVRVLGATLGFSLLATLFFALGPALKTVRLDVNTELKEGAGEAVNSPRRKILTTRNLLVIGQVALSLCLLVAAGLTWRGAINAIRIDPGFDLDGGFFLQVDGGPAGYNEAEVRQLYHRLMERVGSLPGVEATSMALTPPFAELVWGQRVQQGGAPFPPPLGAETSAQGKAIPANYNVIGPDYFRALGVGLRDGREFRSTEFTSADAPRVAIVNSLLAEKLWPGETALGRVIQFAGASAADNPGTSGFAPLDARPGQTFEVVGVVPSFKVDLLRRGDHPIVFVPYGQHYSAKMNLHVRAAQGVNVGELIREVREEARRLDPALLTLEAKSLRFHLETSMAARFLRMGAMSFATFGGVALLLSLIGVYGVGAYLVARRTQEIGVRMALGADRHAVLRLFLREGAILTGAGLAIGLALAAVVGWLMRGILFEVSPFDPLVYGSASALLACAALIACWLPARRATRVDPMEALRRG